MNDNKLATSDDSRFKDVLPTPQILIEWIDTFFPEIAVLPVWEYMENQETRLRFASSHLMEQFPVIAISTIAKTLQETPDKKLYLVFITELFEQWRKA